MRLIGLIFVLLAAVAAGGDYFATSAEGFRLRDVGEVWFLVHRESLQLAQPAIERHVSQLIWDPYVVALLNWPLALVLAGLGAIFLVLGRLFGRGRVERIYPD